MNIIATKSVIDGNRILALLKNEDVWIAISDKDNMDKKELDPNEIHLIDDEYLFERIPKLKGNLNHPNETVINIDYETGEVNINKKHFHLGIPTHSARATRQANTKFSYFRWLRNNRSTYRKSILWIIVFILGGYLFHWTIYIPIIFIAVIKYLTDAKERDMYYSGALLPGIVLNPEEDIIAVLTDLTLGFGKYPIIRIDRVPIPKSKKEINTRLAIAGQYYNTEKYSHWNFFRPLILFSGMKYPEKHDDKIKEIPTIEWLQLSKEVKKLEGNNSIGYYPINIEKTNWKDIEIDKIKWVV